VVGLNVFWIVLMVIGGLLLLLLLLSFTSVRIEFLFKREKGDDRGEVKVRALFGLIRYRVEIPQIVWRGLEDGVEAKGNVEGDSETTKVVKRKKGFEINPRTIRKAEKQFQEMLEHFVNLRLTVRWFLSKVTCEGLTWVTRIGTGDAAEAGFLTGMAWGVKTTLVGVLGSYIRWERPPELHIDPDFHRAVLETHFHSIIRFKVGHAILVAKRLFVTRKGRIRKWQSIPFKV
jgi:hypothetical protein